MRLKSFYPVLGTANIQDSKSFYLRYLPFELTFESEWYVSLRTTASGDRGGQFELALLDYTHTSAPEGFRRETRGLILNIEIDDVDSVYGDFKAAGLPIHLELRSEAWGQRHFISADPDGVLLDLIQVIPPSEEFAAQYAGAESSDAVV